MGEKKKKIIMNGSPDLSRVIPWHRYMSAHHEGIEEVKAMYQEAESFLKYFDWCSEIIDAYVGIAHPGIIGIFLFRIVPAREEVDEWIWVVIGDLPPAYLTTEDCPNPATALDGYIGAMEEWVDAASEGKSVAKLIPVNVPATKENAEKLRVRLNFLDERILSDYREDLDDRS